MKFEITLADGKKFSVGGDRIHFYDNIWTVYSDEKPVAYFTQVVAVLTHEEAEDMPVLGCDAALANPLEDAEVSYVQQTIERLGTKVQPQSWNTPVEQLPTGREE